MHPVTLFISVLFTIAGSNNTTATLGDQGYEGESSYEHPYAIPVGECIKWHPEKDNCTCPPGQILRCLGWFGYADGCICTTRCETSSDCPRSLEGIPDVYCIRSGYCMLGCAWGKTCPRHMKCMFHWTLDCLSDSDYYPPAV